MERREFFHRLGGRKGAMRPPGARSEMVFRDLCDGCAACLEACPQNIIQMAGNNLPTISFAQAGCTFCGRCAEACDRGAFIDDHAAAAPWPWRARVSDACLEVKGIVCRVCESRCEEDAIEFHPALGGLTDVSISAVACTGCGACISICPAEAISMVGPDLISELSR